LEPLSGYLLLGSQLLHGNTAAASAWNFGPSTSQEISVADILNQCQKFWNDVQYDFDTAEHVHEAQRLQLDSSKAKKLLSWKNVWQYKKNIEQTMKWYKSYYQNGEIVSKQQLSEYIIAAEKKGLPWVK
jgi:CDP-glucose 4,6-dehydratase